MSATAHHDVSDGEEKGGAVRDKQHENANALDQIDSRAPDQRRYGGIHRYVVHEGHDGAVVDMPPEEETTTTTTTTTF